MNPAGFLVLATSYSRTTFRRTTIGAAAFHFRVRNGNGWGHCARVTRKLRRLAAQLSGELKISDCRLPIVRRRQRQRLQQSIFKEQDFQSALANRKSAISSGSLISTYRFQEVPRSATAATIRLRFVLRSFDLLCLLEPRKHSGLQRNRKVNDQAERAISTAQLNTLLRLHRQPIDVVVYHGPSGRSHLGIGLALRCFQRLSFPNIATQHCS
jgi:hypothetical protein